MESGKLLKYVNIWVILFLGHSLTIKWDSGTFSLKYENDLPPPFKDKKVTYANSSLKLWLERKYARLCFPILPSILEPSRLARTLPPS